jgi:hypothetical protein
MIKIQLKSQNIAFIFGQAKLYCGQSSTSLSATDYHFKYIKKFELKLIMSSKFSK